MQHCPCTACTTRTILEALQAVLHDFLAKALQAVLHGRIATALQAVLQDMFSKSTQGGAAFQEARLAVLHVKPRAVLHGGHARNTNPCNRQHHRNTRLWARGSRLLPLGTMQWGSSKQAPGFLGNVFGQLSGLGLEASGFVGRVSWRAAELAGTCFDGTGARAWRLV